MTHGKTICNQLKAVRKRDELARKITILKDQYV